METTLRQSRLTVTTPEYTSTHAPFESSRLATPYSAATMPERDVILDLVTVWLTFLRFSEPNEPPELLLADVLLDSLLVVVGMLQAWQSWRRGERLERTLSCASKSLTRWTGREAGRCERFAVTIYLLLMVDALASDCKALAEYTGWVAYSSTACTFPTDDGSIGACPPKGVARWPSLNG